MAKLPALDQYLKIAVISKNNSANKKFKFFLTRNFQKILQRNPFHDHKQTFSGKFIKQTGPHSDGKLNKYYFKYIK